ncbi:MAG TPA: right-handed parallel beta-helix repeat-containing protein [Kofleriaceae bacterium]|nr:right-handed parallel beta-helix repeat-containing protein [Kofleriaceae bacterium]
MVARVLALVALLAACEKRSALYCDKNPEDLAHCPRTDGEVPVMMCTDNASCTTSQRPFCELGSHVCVGCLSNADCTDPTKLNCDPTALECRGCVAHSDCPSSACLPGGVCGDDANVIYVDPAAAANGDGTKTKPVQTIADALDLVTATRKNIKLTGTLDETVLLMARDVVIVTDPGTKLLGKGDPAVKINASQVTAYGLDIDCSGAMNCLRVESSSTARLYRVNVHDAPKSGVELKDNSYLELDQSTVAGNFDGIITSASGTFSITNNFIIHNGSATSAHGGVDIGSSSPANRFEFNTVAHNQIKDGLILAGGITCPLASSVAVPNNLIVANTGSLGNAANCVTTGSPPDADAVPYQFKSITPPYDYHLLGGSKAIDASTITSTITNDVDGDFRPQGAKKDLGADEYKP